MLDFSGNDQKAKLVALHYANQFDDLITIELIENKREVTDKDEARKLAEFYWKMLDASAEDQENGVKVLGEVGLQYWMERLLNIVGGYLSSIGYEDEWNKVCDEI
ncbi:hypothetical protein FKG94_04765 [Exilibacterium tricleocarpae]|uniref:Uncharacterized protein n=1 Tax=Exilibacterium tricleocarpae TaxID=2591008 RepID=A0A545U3F4_9GAMM|nr:hypothetical protein [Exilibacterium tricleocarpae]TQV83988.1 hypothetical protein FKG94_04765 [Exilibacterium tricleocarpae]